MINMFVVLLFIGSIFSNTCTAKVTDKQYGSMPTLFHRDNYDQCMLLEEDALYCSFTYEMEPIDHLNSSEMWKIIHEVSSDEYNYRHDHLRHGICVPLTCPNMSLVSEEAIRRSITDCYNKKFYNIGLTGTVTTLSCETTESKLPVDHIDLIVGAICVIYMVLVIFASFYEGMARYKEKSEYEKVFSSHWGKIISAFSIPRNWERLATVKRTPEVEKLRCLQGVRFYNTFLVILCHTSLSFLMGPVANPKFVETLNDTVGNLFMSSGALAVSTNFMMASFLLCYSLLSHFENKKEINVKYLASVFIHRYIRLTPTLFVVLVMKATWFRHIARGPSWYHIVENDFLKCRRNWWTNILYINNFIGNEDMCLPQTWYLALDTQYFIILLVLIMFMKKHQKKIWSLLGFLLGLTVVATFIQNYVNNFKAFVIPTPESVYDLNNVLRNPQWQHQTTSTIGCFAGPLVGLGYGYIFFKNKNLFKRNVLLQKLLHYTLAYGFAVGIFTIPGFFVMHLRVPHNIFWASLYTALSRSIFTIAVGYGILSVMYGIDSVTKCVLEWPPLYVLGRLTYSAYLVHYFVTIYRSAVARFPLYISNFDVFLAVTEDVAATYMLALLITLFLEMPISELQKILLPSKPKTGSKDTKQEKQL